ncbi:MAG: TIGR00374 family protein [Dictyoglomus sp. NZ13-RE01]|nr:MAG: TIGR00374 family protein [Dictyoglomus sp. NZ13-RE01]
MKNINSTLKKGLRYSISLTILVIIILLIFTTEDKTFTALKKINFSAIVCAISLNILSWFISALRYKTLVNSFSNKISFVEALQIHLSYYFASGITPTSAGGEPLEMYLLSKKNIPLGQATAFSLLRYMTNTLTFAVATPIVIYFYSYLFPNKIVRDLIKYGAVLLGIIIGLFLISLYKPRPIKRLIARLLLKFKNLPLLKNLHPYKIIRIVFKTVDDFHSTLWSFLKDKKLALFQFILLNILAWITYFLIAPTILLGFGLKVRWVEMVLVQIPVLFLLFYVPTPGGSGASELLFSLVFAPYVPKYILGIFIIIWRTLTHYFTLIVGGFILFYILGIKNWGE